MTRDRSAHTPLTPKGEPGSLARATPPSEKRPHAGLRSVAAGMRVRLRIYARRAAEERRKGATRVIGLAALGLGVGVVVYFVTATGGFWLRRQDALDLVSPALSVLYLGVFGALVLSSLGHAANAFFTSQDLWFWNASATPPWARFTDRVAETAFAAVPATLALGVVALTGFLRGTDQPLVLARGLFVLVVIASLPVAIGALLAHVGGALLPAGRLRRLMLLVVGVVSAVALGVLRSARVEQVMTEEGAARLLEEQKNLVSVGPDWLPSSFGARFAAEGDLPSLWLLLACALALYLVAYLSHRLLYLRARDLADDESPTGLRRGSLPESALRLVTRAAPAHIRPLLEKDLLAFLRDPSQWSQLVLLLGIAVIYLINAQALVLGFEPFPMAKDVFIGGMHVGLVTFISAGLAARFAFPQMGLEGPAVWIVEGSPLPPEDVVYAKFLATLPVVSFFPTLVALAGGYVIELPTLLWLTTTLTVAVMSVAMAAWGTGRGSVSPVFDAVSVSELAMGPGALATMGLAVVMCGLAAMLAMMGGGVLRFAGPVVGPLGACLCALVPCLVAGYAGRRALARGAEAFSRRREDGTAGTGAFPPARKAA